MRSLVAPLLYVGRLILWIPPLTPIGIWRSLRHHRKKGVRQAEERTRGDPRAGARGAVVTEAEYVRCDRCGRPAPARCSTDPPL